MKAVYLPTQTRHEVLSANFEEGYAELKGFNQPVPIEEVCLLTEETNNDMFINFVYNQVRSEIPEDAEYLTVDSDGEVHYHCDCIGSKPKFISGLGGYWVSEYGRMYLVDQIEGLPVDASALILSLK